MTQWPRHLTIRSATLAVAATLIFGACGDDDGPSGNAGTIQVTVTPAALTVEQGGSGTVALTLVRGGGFAGTVNLTVTGLPAGVTATLTPAQLTGTTLSATVAVNVGAAVAPGDYTATIHASATGVGEATTTYVLTVTAAPEFALVAEPSALTVAQGASGNATVNITRTNFTGDVALSLDAPPTGVTAVFTPATASGATADVVLSVDGAVAPDTYTLTIQGVGTPGTRTATLELTVTAPADFTLAVAPTTVSAASGGTANATVNITRHGGFAGDIALALDAPPAGITATFNPAVVPGNTSAMTIDVAGTVAPADYTLTVKGTATGSTDQTATLTLTVAALPASIVIALQPTSVSVQQGQSAQTIVTLTRTNFPGDVTFGATGAPTGVTVAFNPATTTTNASTATITVAGTAATGSHPITITASGTGVTQATIVLDLTVTASGPGVNAEWQFCSASEVPVFFAFQDGTSGTWQAVAPTVAGSVTSFDFTVTQGSGGVMFVYARTIAPAVGSRTSAIASRAPGLPRLMERRRATAGSGDRRYAAASRVDYYETGVTYATATELTSLGLDQCGVTASTKTISGTVTGVGAAEFGALALGNASEFFIGGVSSPTVSFEGVQNGVVDFVGSRADASGVPNKFVLFRSLNIPDGGALPSVIDFNGPASSVPASATLTVNNSLGDDLLVSSSLSTANSQGLAFVNDFTPGPTTTLTWYGLAAGQMVAGDVHGINVFAFPSGSTTGDGRILLQHVGAVANQTVTLGPNLSDPTVTSLGGATYPRFSFQGTLPAEYQQAVVLNVSDDAGTGNDLSIFATGGYLTAAGGSSAFDLAIPDAAALTGFPLASRLTAGANTLSTRGMGWSGAGILVPQPQPGDKLQFATRSTAINVP